MEAAAEAMNKQLPKDAQAGSMMPLTEEAETAKGDKTGDDDNEKKAQQQNQVLDTFDVEIDALDTVGTILSMSHCAVCSYSYQLQ